MNLETRAKKKLAQLQKEFEKPKLDRNSIAHLARDLAAVTTGMAADASKK